MPKGGWWDTVGRHLSPQQLAYYQGKSAAKKKARAKKAKK